MVEVVHDISEGCVGADLSSPSRALYGERNYQMSNHEGGHVL